MSNVAIDLLKNRYSELTACIIKSANAQSINQNQEKDLTTETVRFIIEEKKQQLMSIVRRNDTDFIDIFNDKKELAKGIIDFRIALEQAFDACKIEYRDEIRSSVALCQKFMDLTYIVIPDVRDSKSVYMRKYYPTINEYIERLSVNRDRTLFETDEKLTLIEKAKKNSAAKKARKIQAASVKRRVFDSIQIIATVESLMMLYDRVLSLQQETEQYSENLHKSPKKNTPPDNESQNSENVQNNSDKADTVSEQ